jgi:tetratricopeptide (TPR) repeat protein
MINMNDVLLILGFMDVFTGSKKDSLKKGSLEYYEKRLYEFQEQEAETLIDIGAIYLEKNELENALKNFNDALTNYKKLNYDEGVAYTLDLIGDTYLASRNCVMAIKNYKQARDIYAKINPSLENELNQKIDEVGQINDSMDIIPDLLDIEEKENSDPQKEYFDGDYFDEGILDDGNTPLDLSTGSNKSNKISLKSIAKKLEESIMLLENSDTYSVYYKDSKDSDLEYLKEALLTAEVIDDSEGQATLHLMIGDNDLKDKNTSQALDHFDQARKIFEKTNNKKGKAVSMLLMGAVFFVLDEKEEMYDLFKNSFNLFHEIKYKKGEHVARDLIGMLSN